MDTKGEVRQFLTAARGRVSPERAGIATYGVRRVPGLRREEVAQLADVSIAYYTRIERGDLRGVSESVLVALARALQLDEAERAHLHHLARAAGGSPRRPVRADDCVPERVQQLIETMQDLPVIASNHLRDPLASNALGRALFPHLFPVDAAPVNTALYTFLDPRARTFYPEWEPVARGAVSNLRLTLGQHPDDEELKALIGRLAGESSEFRAWWVDQTVRTHTHGAKRIAHPVVGELTLTYEVLQVPSAPGIRLAGYLAEPGTPDADALDLLRSWTAQPAAAETIPGGYQR
ncbi:transcriptional regulator [Brachybacterium sp. P6-10-X1]|uniref:helix-turn-helix transcriptional regulator n=1 Tax=Brachybacterium sp. P6-10-X1 TaxID=1903186 RepID=UPI0009719A2A|nr:helix-turn-helix transcriptional regulator [Brachybacterium sp. P6-10-X1]APX34109.1 transcriptional regulator [Brachybacterium sp. P6-10-X1]